MVPRQLFDGLLNPNNLFSRISLVKPVMKEILFAFTIVSYSMFIRGFWVLVFDLYTALSKGYLLFPEG